MLKKGLSGLQDAGIKRVLLIGGGLTEPPGDYSSVMDLLKTGLFAEYGIYEFDFAGHPEGNPDDPDSEYHLLEKLRWTADREISARIVTQLSLIHISEPTRRTPISYAVFCLKNYTGLLNVKFQPAL